MACDAATLEALAVLTDKNTRLSARDNLICLASVYGTQAGFGTAGAALTVAYMNKFPRLSDRDLDMLLLATLCPKAFPPFGPVVPGNFVLDADGNPVLGPDGNPILATQ